MYEINCYDSYGNTIDYLTQWDYNRKLIMYIDNYDLSYAPEVHFCNQNSVEALVVQSVVEGNKLTVDIPNILLQEHLSLYAYVYLSDANNAASQKTILSVVIPVRYRPKPSDYTYIENIDKVTAATIEQSVYDKVRTSIRDVVFEYLDDNPVTGGGDETDVEAGTYGGYDSETGVYNIPNVAVDEKGRVTNISESVLPMATDETPGYMSNDDHAKLKHIPMYQAPLGSIYRNYEETDMRGYYYFSTSDLSFLEDIKIHVVGEYTDNAGYNYIIPLNWKIRHYTTTMGGTSVFIYVSASDVEEPYLTTVRLYCNYPVSGYATM